MTDERRTSEGGQTGGERRFFAKPKNCQFCADKSLTIDDLASLGSKLSLPEGWTYSTRALTEDYELVTTGLAYVINDDLYNAYQRRT